METLSVDDMYDTEGADFFSVCIEFVIRRDFFIFFELAFDLYKRDIRLPEAS